MGFYCLYTFTSVWNETPKYSHYTKSENTTRKKKTKLLSTIHSSETPTVNMWENALLDLFHVLE